MGNIDGDLMFAIALLIVAPPACAFFLIHSFRPHEKKFGRVYAGLRTFTISMPGTVSLRFHTYDGFLFWFTQTAHEIHAPPEDARILLRRLLRYNLTFGLLAAGCIFVPFLSLIEFRSQQKSLRRQEAFFAWADDIARPLTIPKDAREQSDSAATGLREVKIGQIIGKSDEPFPTEKKLSKPAADDPLWRGNSTGHSLRKGRSLFHTVLAMILASLSILFGSVTIVELAQQDWEVAFGGVLMTALLGSLARDFLRGSPD